jgi:hypothetical protein
MNVNTESGQHYYGTGCVLLWAAVLMTREAYEFARILLPAAKQLDGDRDPKCTRRKCERARTLEAR